MLWPWPLACQGIRAAPSLVLVVSVVPKKTTDVPMMTTRLTTLHTPCDTGLTRDSVLNANCVRARSAPQRKPQQLWPRTRPGSRCQVRQKDRTGDSALHAKCITMSLLSTTSGGTCPCSACICHHRPA